MCRSFHCVLGLVGLLALLALVGENGLSAWGDDPPAPAPPQPIPDVQIVNPPAPPKPVPAPVPVDPAAVRIFVANPQPPAAAPPPAQQPPVVYPTIPTENVRATEERQAGVTSGADGRQLGVHVDPTRPIDDLLTMLTEIRRQKAVLEKQEEVVVAALRQKLKEQKDRIKGLGIEIDQRQPTPPRTTPPATPPN